jgi:hypothetical protein
MSMQIGLRERKNAETQAGQSSAATAAGSAAGKIDRPVRGYGTATGGVLDGGPAGPAMGGD